MNPGHSSELAIYLGDHRQIMLGRQIDESALPLLVR